MTKKRIHFLMEAIVIAAIIVSDLLLKAYAEDNLDNLVGRTVPLISGLLSMTYVQNRGAAFGIFQGGRPFFIVITIIAFFIFFFLLYKKRDGHFLFRFSLSLIIGGTAGNFADRVKLGYMRDMLNFDFIEFPVFNIADAALTVGATLICIYFLFVYKEPGRIGAGDGLADGSAKADGEGDGAAPGESGK
ncbi:MAG: signal peptidase II [Clostridiales bacterium]|nr:signal peptidase II [Clostridiales bacterium]